MLLTKREWTLPLIRHGLAAASLGLLLGFLGPFGSYPAFDRGERYLFWIGMTLSGYLLGLVAWNLLVQQRSIPKRFMSAALLSSIPQAFVAAWALSQLQPGRVINAEALPLLYLCVLATQFLLLCAIFWVGRTFVTQRPSPLPAAQVSGRLAGTAGLIALEAQDHYVQVHTERGKTLVLHRLSDAIADAAGIDGLQVHRSWWVASPAVTGTFVEGGRRWLLLSNGERVPVSRNYLAAVRSRNWPALDKGKFPATS